MDDLKDNTIAILDSGSTVCLLPEPQVNEIYKAFNVLSVSGVSVPFVDCGYRKEKGKDISFDFKFQGKTISVPMSEMVVDAFPENQNIFQDPRLGGYFDDWDGVCMFGISPTNTYEGKTASFSVLGDTFLRSAYVVYDLANEQVGIAEAFHGSNGSSVVTLEANSTKLPSVSGFPGKFLIIPLLSLPPSLPPQFLWTNTSLEPENAAGHVASASLVTLIVAMGVVLTIL